MRTLVVVLGDQLDLDAAAFDDFDPALNAVRMAEVAEESQHVWSAKQRIAVFLAAMRHFAQAPRAAGRTLHYTRLNGFDNRGTLAAELESAIAALEPQRVVMTAPGDWRVWKSPSAVDDDEPEGTRWNCDAGNREAFGRAGPVDVPARAAFEPDDMTREVITQTLRYGYAHRIQRLMTTGLFALLLCRRCRRCR